MTSFRLEDMMLNQYAVPCLRRATAVNYTDADEDAEKILSFLDEVSYELHRGSC